MSVSEDPSWRDGIGETCDGEDVSAELLRLARSGQDEAFADLVAPHRRELHVHCYRILGSVADADDALQETLLSAAEQELLSQLVAAFETADVQRLVALLTDDAWLRMPPVPLEYQGPELIGEFFATVAFRDGRRYRLVPSRANGQPAFAIYLRDPHGEFWHAFGLLVITTRGDRVSAITRFDNAVIGPFGFPRTLAD